MIEWIWRRLKVDDMIGFRADSVLDPLLSCFYLDPESYIPSTLNIGLILWHTQSIVCALKC